MKCGSSVSNYNYCEYLLSHVNHFILLNYGFAGLLLSSPPFKKDLFIYFLLSVAMHGLSLFVAKRVLLSIAAQGFLIVVASLAVEHRL